MAPIGSDQVAVTTTAAVTVAGIYPAEIEWRYSGADGNTPWTTSLGGAMAPIEMGPSQHMSGYPATTEARDNIFPDVTDVQAHTGVDNYLCLYVRNGTDSAQTWTTVKLWVDDPPTVGTLSVAKDSAAVGATSVSTAATIHTAPSPALTFTSPATKADGISLGDIPPGSAQAIWVKRSIPANATSATEVASIRVEGDTGGSPIRTWSNGVKYEQVADNQLPVGFYQGDLIYAAMNEIGVFDVYRNGVSLTSPSTPQTCPVAPTDVCGPLVLGTMARDPTGAGSPGVGTGHDIWCWDLANGNAAHRLTTDLIGVIWPRFKPDGSRIVWSQMRTGWDLNEMLGYWEVHVADLSAWTLANEYSFRAADLTEHFFETYGWVPDGRLIYATCAGMPAAWPHPLTAQIWLRNDTAVATPTRITPDFPDIGVRYQEFAYPAPDAMFGEFGWIIVGVSYNTGDAYNGVDFWKQKLDGTGRARLTSFNTAARYANLGQLAFDPTDPKSFHVAAAEYSTSVTIETHYKITVP
jgi:hypothetical protein